VRFLEARSAHLNQVIFDFQTRRGIVDRLFSRSLFEQLAIV